MPFTHHQLIELFNHLPGMAYRCRNDEDWTMLFVSEGCYGLTGYRPEELVGNFKISFNEIIHKDYRKIVDHQAKEALAKRGAFSYSYPIIHKGGEERWVFEHAIGLYKDNAEAHEIDGYISDITQTMRIEKELEHANIFMKTDVKEYDDFCGIIGRSDNIRKVFNQILDAANSDANVIIYGESGTGKEMVANAIHSISKRANKRFVPVNCGAIPDSLIESEFFGYKKGAFSGANTDKLGYLDQADGGTLLLDEIGEINPNMQIKLLRAIEDYGFMPVGGKEVHKPDIRIIAATNRNLKEEVKAGNIREDFFFRIHIIAINVPPLKERKEDIPLLTAHFLKRFGEDIEISSLPQDLTRNMMLYDWPGNVRELQNFIYRYVISKDSEFLNFKTETFDKQDNMIDEFIRESRGDLSLQSWIANFEKKVIRKTLQDHKWNRGDTARNLKIHYRSLLRKMKQHGIK